MHTEYLVKRLVVDQSIVLMPQGIGKTLDLTLWVACILSHAPRLVIVCLQRIIWRIPLAELKLVILNHSEVRRLILGPFINMIAMPNDATCSLCSRIHQLMKEEQQQENLGCSQ